MIYHLVQEGEFSAMANVQPSLRLKGPLRKPSSQRSKSSYCEMATDAPMQFKARSSTKKQKTEGMVLLYGATEHKACVYVTS